MKREIKFRVWDKKLKKFVIGDLFFEQEDQGTFKPDCYHDEEGEIHSMKYSQKKLDSYHGYIIQQYTGLKDKNGVETYDGDIVKYDNMDGEVGDVGVIEWVSEKDGWDFTGWRIYRTFTQHGPFKVIGNIFENPELLKN